MKPAPPPLTYKPAYIGLFASLFLAAVCNSFLDIQYGTFIYETVFWALLFGISVRIGWRQGGTVTASGKRAQNTFLIVGAIMTVLIFIPMWRFPRVGVPILAMLQASQNCVTVSRRGLHMGLLVSAVMVMFAASHFRADWTMLFYLIPYIAAVVYTLVALQISQRTQDLQQESLGTGINRGQSIAILAATTAILAGGSVLYAATPQVTWPYLFWKYGQPGNIGLHGDTPGTGYSGNLDQKESGRASEGMSPENPGNSGGQSPENYGGFAFPGNRWPSPEEMRQAAGRKGMPDWQSSAIMHMADAVEMTQKTFIPIQLKLDELWQNLKEWMQENRQTLASGLIGLIVLAIFAALGFLLRETRPAVWIRTRIDYVWLIWLGRRAKGNAGALQYYAAMQNLMDLHGMPRAPSTNPKEYLMLVGRRFGHLRRELATITFFFERARYSPQIVTDNDLDLMHRNFQKIYKEIDQLA